MLAGVDGSISWSLGATSSLAIHFHCFRDFLWFLPIVDGNSCRTTNRPKVSEESRFWLFPEHSAAIRTIHQSTKACEIAPTNKEELR